MKPAVISLIVASCLSGLQAAPPNVVVLLADDLGWGDLSHHKGGTPTPGVDKLFREGVELSNYMGWAVCSPTRAMLLTARHPFRVGTGPEVGGELAASETTIAEAFRANGYATGVFGKWHNGDDPDTPEYRRAFEEAFKALPNKKLIGGLGVNIHGFDEAWVYYGGGADYFTRRTVAGRGPVSWWHNNEYRPDDSGYTEDFVTARAREFIRNHREKPFFCCVPFHIIHSLLQAKEEDLKEVDAAVTDQTKRTYAAMLRALDKNVAAILGELDAAGLSENTIVVFSSDNGATLNGNNLPFRGGKHTMYEGGLHLPTVIRWPKGGLAGGKSWAGLCGALDLFPTLIDMAGLEMPKTEPLDGKNLWPALRAGKPSPVESYYWAWNDCDAIRTADWKLVRRFEANELYDIRNDISESNDLSKQRPEVLKDLEAKMEIWRSSLGAQLSHRAPSLSPMPQAAPEGEVLEVTATISESAKPKDRMIIPFASLQGSVFANETLEYDIATAPESLQSGFFYSPFKGDESQVDIAFRRGKGVDQFGREQVKGPAPMGGPGVWEHRVLGMCLNAPNALPRHGMVLFGGKAGRVKVYLDNLQVRHADGTTTNIWSSGKDSRSRKIADTAAFSGVKIRAVPLSQVFNQ